MRGQIKLCWLLFLVSAAIILTMLRLAIQWVRAQMKFWPSTDKKKLFTQWNLSVPKMILHFSLKPINPISLSYYTASSVSGQNQILRCDWLPKRARWSYLARPGPPAMSSKKNFLESHIINPLLTKLVQSRWLDIGLILFFCEFMELNSVSVHKHTKKELG